MKNLIITVLVLWGAIMLFDTLKNGNLFDKHQSFEEYQREHAISDSSVKYTGKHCAECGTKCIEGQQKYLMFGDALSSNQPYYLCGSRECAQNRINRSNKLEKINDAYSNSNAANQYSMGTDGKVHDSAPCVGCSGTGIEKNYNDRAMIEETVCHFCNGTGHLSY